jgi:AcrR family transcriptional regulator
VANTAVRERLLEAAFVCVGRYGIAKTTVEDVSREARLSRATAYRYFPRGKDQLIAEVVAWEVARFFDRLTRAVAHHTDLTDLLTEALLFAHGAVDEHVVLQKILQTEPERLLPMLTTENTRLIALVKQFLILAMQRAPVRADVDPDEAAEYVARMLLSHIGGQGRWDLTDPTQARTLVRTELMAGLLRGG